jgi:hypothetical protein
MAKATTPTGTRNASAGRDRCAALIFFLIIQLFEPLPQFRYRRLQPVALERGIVHGAASVGNIICGRGEVEGAFGRIGG